MAISTDKSTQADVDRCSTSMLWTYAVNFDISFHHLTKTLVAAVGVHNALATLDISDDQLQTSTALSRLSDATKHEQSAAHITSKGLCSLMQIYLCIR